MKFTFQSFFKEFYGHRFYRHFRRPTDFNNKNFQIQFKVENPKELYSHVHQNSGYHPCLTHIYDHGSIGNLKRKDTQKMIYDRIFFDFDVSHPQAQKIKKEIINMRIQGFKSEYSKYEKLKEELRNLIIYDKIAKQAIDEAKDFSLKFNKIFGKEPKLVFSGCKGCHAYCFFDPVQFININRPISWFAEQVKYGYKYDSLDLSVNKDAKSRLSRIPYSKHQYTDLAVVPFNIE